MTPSVPQENSEQVSGNEMDSTELIDEENGSGQDEITAESVEALSDDDLDVNALVDGEDDSGLEQAEPDSDDEGSDDDLDVNELVDGETQSEQESEQVSGNELDDSGDEDRDRPHEKKISKSISREFKGKKGLLLIIATGLFLLTGMGYFFVIGGKSDMPSHKKKEASGFIELAAPKDQLLTFNSFIIPFNENKKFTYITLSISFNLPNKEIRREMLEKKEQFRGKIYDILKEEITNIKEIPSLEKLKEFIIKGTNKALSSGKVSKVYIDKFLAV